MKCLFTMTTKIKQQIENVNTCKKRKFKESDQHVDNLYGEDEEMDREKDYAVELFAIILKNTYGWTTSVLSDIHDLFESIKKRIDNLFHMYDNA